ncbi:hypothetical protein WJX81_005164 [Elliptochloris bilobata]|uniref:Translation initiation factor IF-2, chloroplastic n=1 Tax=Elliptochloris bilobata TaxID=381761 RepID=A0AAW1QDM1_9CHLO
MVGQWGQGQWPLDSQSAQARMRAPEGHAGGVRTAGVSADWTLGAPAGDAPPRPKAKPRRKPKELPKPQPLVLPDNATVRQLAALLKVDVDKLEEVLTELGDEITSPEDRVAVDSAELAALHFNKDIVISQAAQDRDKDAEPRPAVVTVMGHVDHGKTSLLDALRKTAVAAGEAGGITQHIGAFEVAMPESRASLTFLDTPGHAAFSAMRARGAKVTDLVVLVVAATDGVMPQTREALAHARTAGCPIIVALSKCDCPGAEPARVRRQLAAEGLELEENGGSVQVVETAAPVGLGLRELEEAVLLQAELLDLKATRTGPAEGTVVEARIDKLHGPVATVIVKRGTLEEGQPLVLGAEWGRVRGLLNAAGEELQVALPGQPVEVSGLRAAPRAGDAFMVLQSEERARRVSEARALRIETSRHSAQAAEVAAENEAAAARAEAIAAAEEEGEEPEPAPVEAVQLPLIIKADVQGSAEAVRDTVMQLSTDKVAVNVASLGVGHITRADIGSAQAIGARIIAFNVDFETRVTARSAKQGGVQVLCQPVIYRLIEEVAEWMTDAAPRVPHEVITGQATVLQMFENVNRRMDTVAGCRVTEGTINAGERFRVLRGGEVVHEGACASLRRLKDQVQKVAKGLECGVCLEDPPELRPGDVLQTFRTDMVRAKKEDVTRVGQFSGTETQRSAFAGQ